MEEIASRLKSSSIDSDSTVYSEENTGIEIKVRFDTKGPLGRDSFAVSFRANVL